MGRKQTPETRRRISAALKGRPGRPGNPGIPRSKETRDKICASHKLRRAKILEEYLEGIRRSNIKSGSIREWLYEFNYKSRICELCGLGQEWNGSNLVLQLHHIDGDSKNNKLENLQILCPNCHTQTDNWCTKKTNL